jgi:hypothetical protein
MVRLLGTPKIRQHPRLSRVRRESLHLAGIRVDLDESIRFRPPHRIREHNLLVPSRVWLFARLRLIRRQRLGPRIQRQLYGP